MNEVYSASKIGFNYSINNDVNMRMFEIMSCGALLLTNRIDKKSGIYDIFDEGKHIHTYRSKKQLLKLIDYYLENDIERKHKAGYGYSHVIGDHTYSHRVDFMLKCIKERLTPQYNLNL